MQRGSQPQSQTFSLPLTAIGQETEDHMTLGEVGHLDVNISYQCRQVKGQPIEVNAPYMSSPLSQSSAIICLSVNISQASGLQAAAKFLATHESNMKYPSEVGVNCYASVQLTFLPKEEQRITRTVARTFAPAFNCHLDFPCPLLWTDPGQDALSLAEMLEKAELRIDLHHQVAASVTGGRDLDLGSSDITGRRLMPFADGVIIGSTTIPLVGLLKKKTGLKGWHPVMAAPVTWLTTSAEDDGETGGSKRGLQRVVGGLEASVTFAHQDDLERVVHAARQVGWSPEFGLDEGDWELMADEEAGACYKTVVSIEHVVFPLENALIVGQTKLDSNTRVYVRYKVYDRKAVCSKSVDVLQNSSDYLEGDLSHQRSFIFASSSAFLWYLREETLEIQLWLAASSGRQDENRRPRRRDKLVGCAYIDLGSLCDISRKQQRLRGTFPLFKPGSSSLGGACLQAQVTMQRAGPGLLPDAETADMDEDRVDLSDDDQDDVNSRSLKKKLPDSTTKPTDNRKVFSVHLCIERALHLPEVLVCGVSQQPSSYVALQAADSASLTCTTIVTNRTNPVWNYEKDVLLDRDVLAPTKGLVFKVWHKTLADSSSATLQPDKDIDRVLGFVSVDLSPLTAGLKQLSGWYNIVDFSGLCQGQLKVSSVAVLLRLFRF
jgi:C2 domain-containing protein 3